MVCAFPFAGAKEYYLLSKQYFMNRKLLLALLSVSTTVTSLMAQVDTSAIHPVQMDEFIFSANKFEENKKNVTRSIQLINKQEMEWAMPQTSATLLEQTGNVFIQRSQAGGGSAVLRGFEASRVQTVIDGVRMNNAIYRAGHLQNLITVDNNILERVEVLYGPASTLYGSDALGGVIIFNTIQPQLSDTGKAKATGNAMGRYSSAYNEATGHADFNIGFKKFASLTSFTYSRFGDLRQGNDRNPFYGGFGLRKEYVERINDVDSIVANDDPNVQKQSGYTQVDVLEKLLYQQNEHISHSLNLQYSTSSDIPRYDRLTDVKGGKLRYAQWYYGPQDRRMAAYQFNAVSLPGFFNEIKAGLNYQGIEESRHQRERGKNGLQNRIENLSVIGYNVDLRKLMGRHELTIGTDGQYNKVNSEANTKDIVTGEEKPLDTRYPDGGSTMYYGAVYAQHLYKIVYNKLVLNDGVRLNYTSLNSKFNDTTFYPFPFHEAKQQNIAWSGNLGLAYMPGTRWRIAVNGSTGFRAPNVDDMAKVFESAGGAYLMVPNPELKPEYTYNADLGITYIAGNALKVEAGGFYTWFKNAIVTDKFTLNGEDSVEYNGSATAVMASQNKASAYLYGFNAAITANFGKHVTLYSTLNHVFGRYINAAGVEVPLDHIPPTLGKTSLTYRQGHFTGEVYVLYNGIKMLKDYSPSGEDNIVYATANGMPAWYTLNLRLGYTITKNVAVQAALENIMDANYRTFASGISSPGRNLVLTLRGRL